MTAQSVHKRCSPNICASTQPSTRGDEAKPRSIRRNAASRAYYAAYHRCLPFGRRLGLSAEPGHGVHRQLLDALIGSSDLKVKSIGYRLNECRKLRVQADYEIESDFSSREARLAIEQCERILIQINALARKE